MLCTIIVKKNPNSLMKEKNLKNKNF